jgi:hypothetical protein
VQSKSHEEQTPTKMSLFLQTAMMERNEEAGKNASLLNVVLSNQATRSEETCAKIK